MAGKGGSGAAGLAGLAVGGALMAGYMLLEKLATLSLSSGSPSQDQGSNQQEQGTEDKDSSEVANELNAGGASPYKDARKRRQSPERDDGYKGSMEADHIPPLDSWKRATRHREFGSLKDNNPALHEMACSLENDPRGDNLPTIEVPRQCHRVNLTTGNSKISQSVRALLADYIVLGEAERMLKLAFIVAHPVASQQIRRDAGLPEKECEAIVEFKEERILKMYRRGFLELLELYHKKEVINQEELKRLTEFVERRQFLDTESDEYQEILTNVLECMEENKKQS